MLHGSRSFGVGDPVKDGVGHVGVCDRPADGVGGDHLVVEVAPPLGLEEGGPGRLVGDGLDAALDLLEAEVGDKGGEGLVEPEVVPPPHGDEVAEPVVGQLVGDGVGKVEHPLLRYFFPEEAGVLVYDCPRVLHAAPLVLVREYLVVLPEGVGVVEELLVELHGLNCDFEDERGLLHQGREQRLDAEERHGDALARKGGTLYCFYSSSLSWTY